MKCSRCDLRLPIYLISLQVAEPLNLILIRYMYWRNDFPYLAGVGNYKILAY